MTDLIISQLFTKFIHIAHFTFGGGGGGGVKVFLFSLHLFLDKIFIAEINFNMGVERGVCSLLLADIR